MSGRTGDTVYGSTCPYRPAPISDDDPTGRGCSCSYRPPSPCDISHACSASNAGRSACSNELYVSYWPPAEFGAPFGLRGCCRTMSYPFPGKRFLPLPYATGIIRRITVRTLVMEGILRIWIVACYAASCSRSASSPSCSASCAAARSHGCNGGRASNPHTINTR